MAERKSFLLYLDQREPLEALTDVERGKLLSALYVYAAGEEAPEFDGALGMAFRFIAKAIDRDAATYSEKCRRNSERAAMRWHANASAGMQTHANNADNDTNSENNSENNSGNKSKEMERKTAGKPPRPRFTPPTVAQVREYCTERNNLVDPSRFVDFYAAKGWLVGRSPMRDWRAAVRTWEQRDGNAYGQKEDDGLAGVI